MFISLPLRNDLNTSKSHRDSFRVPLSEPTIRVRSDARLSAGRYWCTKYVSKLFIPLKQHPVCLDVAGMCSLTNKKKANVPIVTKEKLGNKIHQITSIRHLLQVLSVFTEVARCIKERGEHDLLVGFAMHRHQARAPIRMVLWFHSSWSGNETKGKTIKQTVKQGGVREGPPLRWNRDLIGVFKSFHPHSRS
jgi:hypothetical protein